jgi:uncharacterized SAM-binding protein YcdF (DUF218 family)
MTLVPLAGLATLGLWLVRYGSVDRSQKADAIIVFGARVWPGGQPSPILRARTRTAFELWQKGMAPKIICTGGVGDYPPAESEVSAELLRSWGVPAPDILTETQSTSTQENVEYASELLRPNDRKVLAVSDPFHLWRCRQECRMVGLEAYTAPSTEGWNALSPRAKAYYGVREAALVVRMVLTGH